MDAVILENDAFNDTLSMTNMAAGAGIAAATGNGTTGRNAEELSLPETVIFSCIFSLIAAAGVVGNLLVIVAVAGDSKMRKSTMNALLLNLAVADLCNVITCIPNFVTAFVNRGWLLPQALCPLSRFFERVFLYTSLLTQLAVGVERFLAIAYPMKVHLLCSRRKVTWWAVVLWFFALACSLPYGIWSNLRRNTCVWGAGLHKFAKLALLSFECVVFYFGPLILIIVLYSFISAKLWSRHTNSQLHEGRTDQGPQETLKTRKSVVKMLIVCVCVYFICYSPIQTITVSKLLFGRSIEFSMSAIFALHCLAYSCSSANPIVYTFYSNRFRRKFAQLLCCRGKYERVSSTVPGGLAMTSNHFPVLYGAGNKNNNHSAATPSTKNRATATAGGGGDRNVSKNDQCDKVDGAADALVMVNPRTKLLSPAADISDQQ